MRAFVSGFVLAILSLSLSPWSVWGQGGGDPSCVLTVLEQTNRRIQSEVRTVLDTDPAHATTVHDDPAHVTTVRTGEVRGVRGTTSPPVQTTRVVPTSDAQLELWAARRRGDAVAADRAAARIRESMERQPASTMIQVRASHDGAAYEVTFADGTRGAFKPFDGGPNMQGGMSREVAAYRMDRLLGIDMVPFTTIRELPVPPPNGPLRRGSLQFWVSGPANDAAVPFSAARERLYNRARFFDYLIGNGDRMYGTANTAHHNFVDLPDGGLAMIDHGRAFLERSRRLSAEIGTMDQLIPQREIFERLRNATPDQITGLLRGVDPPIPQNEIDAVLRRREILIEEVNRRLRGRAPEAATDVFPPL